MAGGRRDTHTQEELCKYCTSWRGRIALAKGQARDKHALRTSCSCAVATFAWLVVLGVACIVKTREFAMQHSQVEGNGDYQRERSARADVGGSV